ncbi:hypothetical protein WICMUC_002937 [Wickerhamomyces mucosus]|uniref:Uncharacterized protein n=1 Tax=Wickerhamomyces mucosus TaxID=1378264 RepID=A0A9P8TE32_9ASCO|nr:hypothetical protein WICMUC_002937 [Wickerhamomyces mucosus]
MVPCHYVDHLVMSNFAVYVDVVQDVGFGEGDDVPVACDHSDVDDDDDSVNLNLGISNLEDFGMYHGHSCLVYDCTAPESYHPMYSSFALKNIDY